MQAMGAALAVGAGATASSGSATAQDSAAEGVLYGVASPALGAAAIATEVADWSGEVNTDVAADESIIHSQSVSEMESYDAHHITYQNYLQDMNTVASLEARHAIASAWEDGMNSSEAYQAALEAIRSYYAQREKNHWEVVNKALTQHSHSTNTILASSEITDDFLAVFVDNSSNSNTDLQKAIISPDRVETEITLHNGDTHTMKSPQLHIQTTDGVDEAKKAIGAFHESWDSDAEVFTVEADSSTNTWETNLRATVQSVGDPADGGLPSRTVFSGPDVMEIVTEITDESDRVVNNYSESFVSDLYAELDAGNITPSDIRGAEGQVRFMSGTDDVSSDAYRMGMLQTLNMEQQDLSKISSTTITYSGYTGLEPVEQDGDTVQTLADHVEGRTMEGVFQARTLPSDGLSIGETYGTQSLNNAIVGYDSNLAVLGSTDGEIAESRTHSSIHNVVADPSDYGVAYLGVDGDTIAVDTTTGAELFRTGINGDYCLAVSPDGSTLYIGGYSDLTLYDTEAREVTATYDLSGDPVQGLAVSPDGSPLYALASTTDSNPIYEVDPSDGSYTEIASVSSTPNGLEMRPGGGQLAVACTGGPTLVNLSDGTTSSLVGTGADDVAYSRDGQTLVAALNGSSLMAFDTDDESSLWEYTNSEGYVGVDRSADGSAFVAIANGSDATLVGVDPNGNELWTNQPISDYSRPGALATISVQEDFAGIAEQPLMYDAPNSEEVRLESGLFTADDMTDSSGNTVESTSGEDWGAPEYGSYDSQEFVDYTKGTEQFQLEEAWADDGSIGIPGVGGDGGSFLDWL
ncbi:hypothetical protein C486_00345, partial [Natrinema gari JCM 14663]